MSRNEFQSRLFGGPGLFSQEEFKVLSKLRIIQKNLVHVQGFPDSIADKNLLAQTEYFGQFGKITKIVVVAKEDEITKKKSNSAYITFSTKEEAAYCVLAIDSIMIEGHIVRAFFGTSKYCIHFLNNVECYNKDKCMFLHSIANESDILGSGSKFGYAEHIKLAKEIINFYSIKTKNAILNMNIPFRTILPGIKTIYSKGRVEDSSPKSVTLPMGYDQLNKIVKNFQNESKLKNYLRSVSKKASFGNVNNNNNINKSCIPLSGSITNIFKYKNESRFFNISNIESKSSKAEDMVPKSILNLIDELTLRYPFFKQYDKEFSLKRYELFYLRDKCNKGKDSWFDFILENAEDNII